MTESEPYKVYNNSRKRFVTIPSTLADQLNLNAGDWITWEIKEKTLILRKVKRTLS